PMLVVTAHLDETDDGQDQLEFFRPDATVKVFPAYEVLPGESNISHELAAQRLELLAQLAERGETRAPGGGGVGVIVAAIQALMQPSTNRELLSEQLRVIRANDSLDRDALVAWLADHGYTRLDAVEDAGDFAVRGEIVDVWPPGDEEPVRIDFFGDTVESI